MYVCEYRGVLERIWFVCMCVSIEVCWKGCGLYVCEYRGVLEGLSENVNVTGVKLDVSCNELGGGAGLQPLLCQFETVPCVSHLDLSDTGLDAHMVEVIVALAQNQNVRHLKLGKNFNGRSK